MSQGKIWPEYWIDCAGCSNHEPIGETTEMKAELAANLRLQYQKIRGQWYCPKCVSEKEESAKLYDAIMNRPETVIISMGDK